MMKTKKIRPSSRLLPFARPFSDSEIGLKLGILKSAP
jgi:hypothetical protein